MLLSHLLNTLTGGKHDHSFSARVGYLAHIRGIGWAIVMAKIIDTMLWFHPNHCYREYIRCTKAIPF